jgi:peptidoglycan hydrolase-like protein with peptidoglycan-binding domain
VENYFNKEQGTSDGATAFAAAKNLGLPSGTVIYFAVDVDIQEGDINGIVMPYINAVKSYLDNTIYKTGIYGTRNVCLHAQASGIKYSFVADMSYGWSGNLGFSMPSNWAYDQYASDTVDGIEIDKVALSGSDSGVSKIDSHLAGNNSTFINQLKTVVAEAEAYVSGVASTISVPELVTEFYRQFDYKSAEWIPLAGGLDSGWLATANSALEVSGNSGFASLYDSVTGIKIGVPHLMAVLNALLFWGQPADTSGIQDLGGWCGDLLTSMADSMRDESQYASYYESISAHAGKLDSFGREDLLDDVDALNLYNNIRTQSLLSSGQSLSEIFTTYYNSGNSSRFNSFLNNRFNGDSATVESETKTLLTGGSGTWAAEYNVALSAFKSAKMKSSSGDYSNYTNSQAADSAKAFRALINVNLE